MTMLLHFDENVPLPLLASCRHHAQANHVLQPGIKCWALSLPHQSPARQSYTSADQIKTF